MKNNIHFTSYLAHYWEWEMFPTTVVEEVKTYILYSMTIFKKSCHLWDTVEKYGTARRATDDNMVYAHCMLDT
jgi:hypothetical protein